jgi:hypothetical protein
MSKPLTRAERYDLLAIRQLQHLNCYAQLVRKLCQGQGACAVARWAMQLGIEGEAGQWSFYTWRRYLGALAKRVRRIVVRHERVDVRPLESDAVLEEVEWQMDALVAMPEAIPKTARKAWQQARKSLKNLDAETILKYAFVRQVARVAKMVEVEQKLGILLPEWNKNIDSLIAIGDALRKLEVGQAWMKGTDGEMPYGDPGPGERLPRREPVEPDSVEMQFNELDEVEETRRRAAAARVIEMFKQWGFEIGGLGADAADAAEARGGSK